MSELRKPFIFNTFDTTEQSQQPTPTSPPASIFDVAEDVTERPTTSFDLHEATERPTTSFDLAEDTQEPTPTALNTNDVTHGPTPTVFRFATLNPTPSNFITSLITPSPNSPIVRPSFEPTFEPSYIPTTPSTCFPTTFQPTESSTLPTPIPTNSPTYAGSGLSVEAAMILSVSLLILVLIGTFVGCFFWWGGDKPKSTTLTNAEGEGDGEEAPFSPTSPLHAGYGATDESENVPALDAPAAVINTVLQKGIYLHTSRGPKKIKMEIAGQSLHLVGSKKFVVKLAEIGYVEKGRKTHTFMSSVSSAAPERCLSLVLQSTTVDLEADSMGDRDLLYENFITINSHYHATGKDSDNGSSNESAI